MNYEVKAKRANGKWWGFGNIKTNQWGNLQLSMKVTPELIELINSKQGQWINFALFEPREQSAHDAAKSNGYQPQNDLDDSIPW